MSGTLLVAGYVNVDLLAHVDRLPASGDRVTARSITRAPGGMAANVACAASRLGACVRFFGVVGRDEDGNAAVEDFQRFRVNTEGIMRVIQATTTALILVEPSGNRAIVSEPTSMDYTPLAAALSSRSQPEGDSLYVDGYHVLSALPLLRRARHVGMMVAADFDGLEPEELAHHVDDVASAVNIALLNRRSALGLAPNPESAAMRLIDLGVKTVAITLGSQGALVGERGRLIRVRAPHIEAQDTTGAGDVFAAGFVVACMEGRALPEAGRFAVAASALSVQGLGARGYLPNREQVLHMIHGADVSS